MAKREITSPESFHGTYRADTTTSTAHEKYISPIIDADRKQDHAADPGIQIPVGKQIGQIYRRTEGKFWHIIGTSGPYLKIQTKNSNGTSNIRLIAAAAYQRRDCYPSRLPVYSIAAPIIDADGIQAARSTPRRIVQPDIIVAREMAQ